MIAQARHTAKKMADQSGQAAARTSFLSWFGLGSADLNGTFAGSGSELEESGECLKKTHEFLDRALENLCQIFKVRCCCFDRGVRVTVPIQSKFWCRSCS